MYETTNDTNKKKPNSDTTIIRIVRLNWVDSDSLLVTCICVNVISSLSRSHFTLAVFQIVRVLFQFEHQMLYSVAICVRSMALYTHKVKGNIGDHWSIHSHRFVQYIHSSTNIGSSLSTAFILFKIKICVWTAYTVTNLYHYGIVSMSFCLSLCLLFQYASV